MCHFISCCFLKKWPNHCTGKVKNRREREAGGGTDRRHIGRWGGMGSMWEDSGVKMTQLDLVKICRGCRGQVTSGNRNTKVMKSCRAGVLRLNHLKIDNKTIKAAFKNKCETAVFASTLGLQKVKVFTSAQWFSPSPGGNQRTLFPCDRPSAAV